MFGSPKDNNICDFFASLTQCLAFFGPDVIFSWLTNTDLFNFGSPWEKVIYDFLLSSLTQCIACLVPDVILCRSTNIDRSMFESPKDNIIYDFSASLTQCLVFLESDVILCWSIRELYLRVLPCFSDTFSRMSYSPDLNVFPEWEPYSGHFFRFCFQDFLKIACCLL